MEPSTPRIYTTLLMAYPRRWRANGRGEELMSLLLDSAAATGRTRPTVAESVDVVLHGMGERARDAEVVIPTASRAHLAEASLAAAFGLSAFLTLGGEVRVRGLSDGASPYAMDLFLRHTWGPFLTLGIAVYVAWFLAMIRYVAGSARGCRELAMIAGAITLAIPELSALTDHQRPPGGMLATLAVLALGTSLLPAEVDLRGRARLGPLTGGVLVLVGLLAWRVYCLNAPNPGLDRTIRASRTMFYWAPNDHHLQINRSIEGIATWAAIGLVVISLAIWYRDRTWLPAAAFLVVPLLTLRLGTPTFSGAHSSREAVIWIGAIAGLIVLHGMVLVRLLRLPWRKAIERPAHTVLAAQRSP
jgi:hypothetical protein